MTKIGVGVGEEFPIDDKPEAGGSGPGYDPCHDHGGCGWDYEDGASEDWRPHQAEWQAWRREWRARRREWRRHYGYGGPSFFWGLPWFVRAIVMVAVIVLAVRIAIHAPIIVLGLVLLGVFYAAHRRHDYMPHPHDVTPPPEGH